MMNAMEIKRNDQAPAGTMRMSEKEFNLISRFIYSELGIKMPPAKKLMLSVRLSRRLKTLGLPSYMEYYNYLFTTKDRDEEFNLMIDAVTTNKTEFFREPNHFTVLVRDVLPGMLQSKQVRAGKPLEVWCAGCSTGEEAYTLAFVLEDFFQSIPGGDYRILATDVSRRVLRVASDGVYRDGALGPIPQQLKRKYLMKGKGSFDGQHRVVPELRKKIKFRQLNFMDADFGIRSPMNVIFCRNVVIYFDKQTQVEFFGKIFHHLNPGGFLFIGSSETLFGISESFTSVGPTVYRRS
jgi:chemotaxis protein methyltransferase CheR